MSQSQMNDREFEDLLSACQEIAGLFPDGVVFIGGIAVYFHVVNFPETRDFAEFTHYADFYISLADLADLRDIEEVVSNRRLSKHQLTKRGFEFDIYTERHSALIVPFDQILTHAVSYETVRVACLEHLIVLKLEAYRERHASAKGQKDAKDLIRLALVGAARKGNLREDLIRAYLSEDHFALLERVKRGPEFLSMAKGNAQLASKLRQKFNRTLKGFESQKSSPLT
jgi:hypothetical protein